MTSVSSRSGQIASAPAVPRGEGDCTSRTVHLIGNAVFALLAVVLLAFATIRRDKFGDS